MTECRSVGADTHRRLTPLLSAVQRGAVMKFVVDLFNRTFGEEVVEVSSLSAHASERRIYRLRGRTRVAVGVQNTDLRENIAFVEFARHFSKFGLPVPEIYAEERAHGVYLEQDLGDETLYHRLSRSRTEEEPFPSSIEALYAKVLTLLPRFQLVAGRSVEYRYCHQYPEYGRDSMLWDMRFFRDSFLRVRGIVFDEARLERDFEAFAVFLETAYREGFLYRDLQSRNVMLVDEEPWFIDFQAGRRGALHYDVVSLLFQSSAMIPSSARQRLLGVYLDALAPHANVTRSEFMRFYPSFVIIRMMQVLGTYGKQGLVLGKPYFLQSIPLAVRNIRDVLLEGGLPKELSHLRDVFDRTCEREL